MNVDVFGSKLHDAVIHEGILVTTSHTTKIMKLYSFEDILKNNMTEHFNIGDRIEGKGVIGQKPLGFPVNVKLKEEPPVLFSIMCEDFDVTFSEFVPTVCITTDKDYCYKVNDFIKHDELRSRASRCLSVIFITLHGTLVLFMEF